MNRNRVGRIAAAAAAVGVFFTATSAPAQTPGLPRTQAEFEKQINLTADQKSKIETITKKYQPRIQAVTKKYEPEARKLQEQMVALQKKMVALNQKAATEAKPLTDQYQKEVDAILTPSQREKIKQIRSQLMQRGQPGAPGGR
jgi:Spy/CpxP family protein refolding chaperone